MCCARRLVVICALTVTASLTACSTSAPRQPDAARVQRPAAAPATVAPQESVREREFNLALRAMKAGRDKDAERMLRQIITANPDLPGPHANLGIILQRNGRLPEAVESLARAVSLDPGNAVLQNLLAIAYRNVGRFHDARKAYEAALRIRPDYALAHLNLGILYDLYLGNAGKALEHYQLFRQFQAGDDQQVDKWIIELQQRSRRISNSG